MGTGKVLFHANAAASFLAGHYSGINRVTYEFLCALSKRGRLPVEFSLYLQGLKSRKHLLADLPFGTRQFYWPNRIQTDKILQYLPIRESLSRFDLFHVPHNFDYCFSVGKTIVTLHDAMIYAYPQEFPNTKIYKDREEELRVLLRRCRAILTCSYNSKHDILKHVDIPEEKVYVAPWGVNRDLYNPDALTEPEQDQIRTLVGQKPFFLSVSCDVGRKNTVSVVRAYREFVRQNPDHNLVLVWGGIPESIIEECRACENGKVILIDRLDDIKLSLLYKAATALFFVSKYEGFGLPLLESMSCGTPVVTCRNSSLIEVGGDAAIFVAPDDISEIAEVMENFENGAYDSAMLRERSICQSEMYSWDQCVEKTLACYQDNL